MYEYNCNINFLELHSNKPELVADEILNSGLDALLWIAPTNEFIAPINRLIDQEFPIAVVSSWNYPDLQKAKSNTVGYDFEEGGRNSARRVLKYNFRNVVNCGEKNIAFEAWRDEVIKNGIDFKDEFLITGIDELDKRLPYLLENYPIDAIFTSGDARRYQKIFDIVQKSSKNIDIFATYSSTLPKIQALYPNLEIHSKKQRKTSFSNYGKQAANVLIKQIKEDKE